MEGEQVAILRSLDVESVKRVKAILDGNKSNSFEIPKDLFDSISNVGMEEKRGGVGSIVTQINTTAEEARKAVDEVMQILDNEQYENEQMRVGFCFILD